MKLSKILVLFSFLISILFISCDNKQDNQTTDKSNNLKINDSDIKSKIEKITQILNKAVLSGDYETQLKYFTEDAIIAPPIGPVIKGKNAIRDGFDRNAKENVVLHSFNATIEDLWVCGDRVYERGTWAMAQSSNLSKKPKAYYGSYFEIWKVQSDSSLLIDYMIFTLGFNPFENN